MTPQQFARIRKLQEDIKRHADFCIAEALEMAEAYPPPPAMHRQKATAKDIVEHAVIWHERPTAAGGDYWTVVEAILDPRDEWNAYTYEGCVYGLHEAYIDTRETTQPTH